VSAETTDGEALLLRYHEQYTGATVFTFADARDASGRSSYQRLVDDVSALGAEAILDLACGDGYLLQHLVAPGRTLTGVDMSAAELDAAHRRLGNAATLEEARATALPFADASFDCVVSHLALMLMERLDDVVREISRVLKPGGWCCAVVGGRSDDPPPHSLRLFRETWLATVGETGHALPPIGDPRSATDESLAALFSASGFVEFASERFAIRRPGSAREIAEHYGLFYPPASLPEAAREAFVQQLTESLIELERQGETIELVATLLHLRARRVA